jgi:hypothetical protein
LEFVMQTFRNPQSAIRKMVGAVLAGLFSAVLPVRAQQTPAVLRDFAMGGGNYYLRAPEFVDASNATFLKDDDHVIGVAGEGIAKAYPAAAVTWHHGLEDHLGKLPIFVTW